MYKIPIPEQELKEREVPREIREEINAYVNRNINLIYELMGTLYD